MTKWISWTDSPPQLQEPILLTDCWKQCRDCIRMTLPKNVHPEANAVNLWWAKTGIYRQEYFDVTGRWE